LYVPLFLHLQTHAGSPTTSSYVFMSDTDAGPSGMNSPYTPSSSLPDLSPSSGPWSTGTCNTPLPATPGFLPHLPLPNLKLEHSWSAEPAIEDDGSPSVHEIVHQATSRIPGRNNSLELSDAILPMSTPVASLDESNVEYVVKITPPTPPQVTSSRSLDILEEDLGVCGFGDLPLPFLGRTEVAPLMDQHSEGTWSTTDTVPNDPYHIFTPTNCPSPMQDTLISGGVPPPRGDRPMRPPVTISQPQPVSRLSFTTEPKHQGVRQINQTIRSGSISEPYVSTATASGFLTAQSSSALPAPSHADLINYAGSSWQQTHLSFEGHASAVYHGHQPAYDIPSGYPMSSSTVPANLTPSSHYLGYSTQSVNPTHPTTFAQLTTPHTSRAYHLDREEPQPQPHFAQLNPPQAVDNHQPRRNHAANGAQSHSKTHHTWHPYDRSQRRPQNTPAKLGHSSTQPAPTVVSNLTAVRHNVAGSSSNIHAPQSTLRHSVFDYTLAAPMGGYANQAAVNAPPVFSATTAQGTTSTSSTYSIPVVPPSHVVSPNPGQPTYSSCSNLYTQSSVASEAYPLATSWTAAAGAAPAVPTLDLPQLSGIDPKTPITSEMLKDYTNPQLAYYGLYVDPLTELSAALDPRFDRSVAQWARILSHTDVAGPASAIPPASVPGPAGEGMGEFQQVEVSSTTASGQQPQMPMLIPTPMPTPTPVSSATSTTMDTHNHREEASHEDNNFEELLAIDIRKIGQDDMYLCTTSNAFDGWDPERYAEWFAET
jgi:hypothetical protein